MSKIFKAGCLIVLAFMLTGCDNFRVLLSDEQNAIGDFESLTVTIASIGICKEGLSEEENEWIVLAPETEQVDLTNLVGLDAQSIWEGELDPGNYNKIFLYVSEVVGILKSDGSSPEVKLPSNKLQISSPFTISTMGSPTEFVYDLTVIKKGSEQSGYSYNIQPQLSESGPNKDYDEVDPGGNDDENFDLTLDGAIKAGEQVTLTVMFDESPVTGADVSVNAVYQGQTDGNGNIVILLPDAEEVKIKAETVDGEGELEFSLETSA